MAECRAKSATVSSAVVSNICTSHHAALPANHHSMTLLQASAAGDVTTVPPFYPERLSGEAVGQTNALLHVRITICVIISLQLAHFWSHHKLVLLLCVWINVTAYDWNCARLFGDTLQRLFVLFPQRNRHIGLEEMERFARRFKRRRIALGSVMRVRLWYLVAVVCT